MTHEFPSSFRFGVGDSDLQVIGERNTRENESSQPTMWNQFSRKLSIDSPDLGIDRYGRFTEDIEIMKSLGIQHYRTSVSMARMLKPNGEINSEAAKWYKNYFKDLKRAGIKIYATLYHWELPQALSEIGGWKNPKTIDSFVDHSEAVYENLGENIEEYFILNEPYGTAFKGYFYGSQAPGEKNIRSALQAAHNLLLAQGLAFRKLNEKDPTLKISTVYNVKSTYPATQRPEDVASAILAKEARALWFSDPLFLGKYPTVLEERLSKFMPQIGKGDMDVIRIGDKLHALGINYYDSYITKASNKDLFGFETVEKEGTTYTGIGKVFFAPPLYPEGFFDVLTDIYRRYKGQGLSRIYVSENGSAWEDKLEADGNIRDTMRISFFAEHLRQTLKAIDEGVPIQGYFAWTLMDNYEWGYGYKDNSRFGIVYVDRKTMKRTLKESALWYKDLIKTHTLPNIH